jgi:hypothetical protein
LPPSPWPTPPNLPYQGELLHAVNTHVEIAPPPADTPNSPGRVMTLINAVEGLLAVHYLRKGPHRPIKLEPHHSMKVMLIRPYPAREMIMPSNLTKRMTITLQDRQRKIMLKTGQMIGERYTTTIKFEEVRTDNIEDGDV